MVRRFTGPCSRLEVVGPNFQEDPTTEKSVLEALTSLDPNESADGSGRVPSLAGLASPVYSGVRPRSPSLILF